MQFLLVGLVILKSVYEMLYIHEPDVGADDVE